VCLCKVCISWSCPTRNTFYTKTPYFVLLTSIKQEIHSWLYACVQHANSFRVLAVWILLSAVTQICVGWFWQKYYFSSYPVAIKGYPIACFVASKSILFPTNFVATALMVNICCMCQNHFAVFNYFLVLLSKKSSFFSRRGVRGWTLTQQSSECILMLFSFEVVKILSPFVFQSFKDFSLTLMSCDECLKLLSNSLQYTLNFALLPIQHSNISQQSFKRSMAVLGVQLCVVFSFQIACTVVWSASTCSGLFFD